MNDSWYGYYYAGDQWFITYACQSPFPLQNIAWTALQLSVELYLKAKLVKETGATKEAFKFGHNIEGILRKCQEVDPSFLPSFHIKRDILQVGKELFRHIGPDFRCKKLTDSQNTEVKAQLELYVLAHFGADLKYLGAPLKTQDGQFCIGFSTHNPMWINFFKEARMGIGVPCPECHDGIKEVIDLENFNRDAREYLSKLYL